MYDNPYSKMIEIMRQNGKRHNPPPLMLGKVLSVEPFTIQVNEIQLFADDVLVSDVVAVSGFEAGDTLALLPIEGNGIFIVLCRVVRLA